MSDVTHDPARRSWVASANEPDTDFPIQNLPYARFRRKRSDEPWRIGVAIGDQIVDLAQARREVPWSREADELLGLLGRGDLYALMSQPPEVRRRFRRALFEALEETSVQGPFLEFCLVPQAEAEYTLPCRIGDYTDFYTGIHHATAVGKLFRPDNPLLPNYKWVPIGYHGRASSIRVGPHELRRPWGQLKAEGADPVYAPTKRLDIELELGAFVALPNALGEPVPMAEAEDHLFGLVLLNDWSARDIQPWEYQPLGPFLSKSFATTISPWIVTMEALEPYRVPFTRPEGDPPPLPYLDSPDNRARGLFDIALSVLIQTPKMRAAGQAPVPISHSNLRDAAYWTPAQLLVHHTSNGCNLATGDLLGTGTLSGPAEGQSGSLLELSQGGKQPIGLPNGETRTFLEDGDTIVLRATCRRDGAVRIGFGDCVGTVGAARAPG
jgi:fumarylacetoacetase